MFSVTVEAGFSAIHQVKMPDGDWEPPHGHDWLVRACCTGPALDHHGMVVDFVEARHLLVDVLDPFHHQVLNDLPHFSGQPPTAEAVARVVYDRLRQAGLVSVTSVEVVEAPGCTARYHA